MTFDSKANTNTSNAGNESALILDLLDRGMRWIYELRDDAARPDTSPSILTDWKIIESYLGRVGHELNEEDKAKIAIAWRSYFAKGISPSLELESIFQRYSTLAKQENWTLAHIPSNVEGVFGRLLATDQQIEVKRTIDLQRVKSAVQSLNSRNAILDQSKSSGGIIGWLQRKGEEKSRSNIIDGLRPLVAAVRTDINELTNEPTRVSGQTAAIDAMVDGRQPWDADSIAQFEQGLKRWRSRKAKVVEAQKKLCDDLALWSSLPPERSLNEAVLPALFSGNLVALSEPSFGPVVVAAYRVCETVARQKGVSLEAHTPPEILQMVNDAGNLYK